MLICKNYPNSYSLYMKELRGFPKCDTNFVPKAICEVEANFYKPQMIKYAREKAVIFSFSPFKQYYKLVT